MFCLDDGPRVLDCLEFDDRLRFVDGLDDAAFLAMDLERLGRARAGDARCSTRTPSSPATPRRRRCATTTSPAGPSSGPRSACLRAAQGDPAPRRRGPAHADLALRHLARARCGLVLVGGLPGTGKSTLAGGLADRVGAALLCGDRVRNELAGLDPPNTVTTTPYGEGGATPARTDALYEELLRRAGALLERGESVVIDAAWINHRHREAAAELAARTHSELVVLRCAAPHGTARQRLATRERSISYATTAIAAAMAADSEPWPQARSVDTSGSVARGVEQATVAWASSVRG